MDALDAVPQSLGAGVFGTAFVLGLRHGIDWDHLAAIGDITSSQHDRRSALLLSSLYAVGHAAVVFVLGLVAIRAGDLLPAHVDEAMTRVVGVSLLVLGTYVLFSVVRHGRMVRMRSRWMLIFSGVARGMTWVRTRSRTGRRLVEITHDHEHSHDHHDPAEEKIEERARAHAGVVGRGRSLNAPHSHRHTHRAQMPEDPFLDYGKVTSLAVGMIHGVGAETPSQMMLFLAAAGANGGSAGTGVLLAFLGGLFISNLLVAAACTFGCVRSDRSFPVYAAVAHVTAAFSLWLGVVYATGHGSA